MMRQGDVLTGENGRRWKLGERIAVQGVEGCTSPMCTRVRLEDGTNRCVGYHCGACGESSSMYGHFTHTAWWDRDSNRAVEFPDGVGYFRCQPEFAEAVQVLRSLLREGNGQEVAGDE